MSAKENYDNIIVGVDGSEASEIAFAQAVTLAKQNNAKLHVAQVINNVVNYLPATALEELRGECEDRYSNLEEQANNMGFTNLVSIIKEGSPKKLLAVTLPESVDADLIVLGATGRHFISESLLGSIAHYATTHAKCNVLIVR